MRWTGRLLGSRGARSPRELGQQGQRGRRGQPDAVERALGRRDNSAGLEGDAGRRVALRQLDAVGVRVEPPEPLAQGLVEEGHLHVAAVAGLGVGGVLREVVVALPHGEHAVHMNQLQQGQRVPQGGLWQARGAPDAGDRAAQGHREDVGAGGKRLEVGLAEHARDDHGEAREAGVARARAAVHARAAVEAPRGLPLNHPARGESVLEAEALGVVAARLRGEHLRCGAAVVAAARAGRPAAEAV
mmetsp:Transcript_63620/g.166616  ORF Transcript_63620/g.166616 Transcript_63620/m.166616 type:complete len:244 (-) Transcript_63620:670-1401(-)